MLRRTLFVGASALVLLHGGVAWPQDDKGYETLLQLQARSLPEIKAAILAETGYEEPSIELQPAPHQLIITVVNSKLVDGSGADRVGEATAIASAVTKATATKPQFHDIEALHIDYVSRKEGKGTQMVDRIDFRKDPYGTFRHHVS